MAKVVRRIINHRYIPFKPTVLVEGTSLPFDCYIKKYNDYVIIIEAETVLTTELLEKLLTHDKVYVHIHDSGKFKQYTLDYPSSDHDAQHPNDEVLRNALSLPQILSASDISEDEQLLIIYKSVTALMKYIFDGHLEKLPLDAIYSSLDAMVKLTSYGNIMARFCAITPDVYSTHSHSTNVGFLSVFLASALGFSKDDLISIAYAGLLHDIGKLKIDTAILLKPERLSEEEYERVKWHSEYGYEILQNNGITNESILNAVRYHHEKLDGSGYPKQLRGKMIPKYARIIGLCDAFDALTVRRTFRKNYTSYEALLLMKQEMNKQFDEEYMNMLIQMLK